MSWTIEQIREAHKNAVAAGDNEAAQQLQQAAVQMAMASAPKNEYDATEGMSTAGKVRAGIGQGMTNVARHVGNMVGAVSDEDLQSAKELDRDLLNTGGGKVGAFIGETAATALPVAGASAGVGRLGAGAARLLSNPLGRGVFEGAVQGGVMADPNKKLSGVLGGAAAGGIVPAIGSGFGKLARGIQRTPEAERLLNEGVDLTPGQMNPGGIINQMEESWQSVPGVGAVIRGARENAQQTFQRTAIEKGAAPGAKIARGEVSDMLDSAYQSFQPLYDQAKGFPVAPTILRTAGQDVPLLKAFRDAASTKAVRADNATRKSVDGWLRNQLTRVTMMSNRKSDDLLELRSLIRAESRKARARPGDDAAAELLDHAEGSVTKALESQLPPDAIKALNVADSKYGAYKVIEDAVARAKDTPGGFTASKLSEAVRAAAGQGAGKGNYARGGGGDLRDLSSAGTSTMNVRSPATGARLAAIGIPLGLGAANPAVAAPAAGLLLGMVGTKTGRKLAAGQTKAQLLAQALLERSQKSIPAPAANVLSGYARRASVSGLLPRE